MECLCGHEPHRPECPSAIGMLGGYFGGAPWDDLGWASPDGPISRKWARELVAGVGTVSQRSAEVLDAAGIGRKVLREAIERLFRDAGLMRRPWMTPGAIGAEALAKSAVEDLATAGAGFRHAVEVGLRSLLLEAAQIFATRAAALRGASETARTVGEKIHGEGEADGLALAAQLLRVLAVKDIAGQELRQATIFRGDGTIPWPARP